MRHAILILCTLLIFQALNAQESTDVTIRGEKSLKAHSGKMIQGQAGSFMVPENRNNPNSENIKIEFVRLKSANPNPGPPVFYLAGGPGSSSTWQARDEYYLESWLPFLEQGDVILVDQRGTGDGTNRVLYIWKDAIPENILADATVAQKHFKAIGEKALIDFKEKGVDLRGYTTTQNANDIDDLRKALGYDKISLVGFSYGTHLGQAYIRDYEKHVENAILIGVEGPNHTYKLPMAMDIQWHKIALMAKADSNVNKEVPDLVALYKKVAKKLKANPAEVQVNSPFQQPMKVKVSDYGLALMLRFDVGDASDIPVFPRLLYTIDQGDYSMLQWFVQKRIRGVFGVQAMSATMDAASGASENRKQLIKEQSKKSMFSNVANYSLGTYWPTIVDLGEAFRSPMISPTRTLFMSGTLDFNTPPYQAEEVRWGFSNSSHIIVTNAGHEQIMTHPKAIETMARFLKGEDVNDVALSHPTLRFIPVKGETGKLWHPSMGKRD